MSSEDRLVQQELERQRKKNAKKKSKSSESVTNRYSGEQNRSVNNDKQIKKDDKAKKIEERKNNNELMRTTTFFAVLFFSMVCYYAYFLATDSKIIINNSYNKRIATYANTIIRGKIYTEDNECIAFTESSEGTDKRIYPYNELYCHVIGTNSLERGKTGIEKLCDYEMLTSNINPILKAVYEFKGQKCLGNDVVTTLNSEIQQYAYDALGDNDGAVVVMDSDTGAILAMVSKPDYNPNDLEALWEEIDNQDDTENKSFLLNRATQGKYTPGSIFKIFTTLEYLRQNNYKDEFLFYCDGEEHNIKCYNGSVHGNENLTDAFAYSCNGAFATIGYDLNMDRMNEDMQALLFNSKLPIDMEYTKSVFDVNNDSSVFDKTQSAIGQGVTTVSPMHMAMLVQAIAHDGMMMKPYVVSEIKGYNGATLEEYKPTEYKRMFTKKESTMLKTYMEAVVEYGTATNLNSDKYKCGGKTGTAQIDENDNVNSWFVGYGKNDNKNITVSVCIENVPDGSVKAVNSAQYIFDKCFE